jgi:hypothetical protein
MNKIFPADGLQPLSVSVNSTGKVKLQMLFFLSLQTLHVAVCTALGVMKFSFERLWARILSLWEITSFARLSLMVEPPLLGCSPSAV